MRSERTREELGVELSTQEERVDTLGELGYFHQPAVRRLARKNETRLFQLLYILRVDLVAVAVALLYLGLTIGLARDAPPL